MKQESLFKAFVFSCREIGVKEDVDLLRSIYFTLLSKMVHTHGNEFIQNRRLMANLQSGKKVDAPVMLRDTLKVLAAQGKSEN